VRPNTNTTSLQRSEPNVKYSPERADLASGCFFINLGFHEFRIVRALRMPCIRRIKVAYDLHGLFCCINAQLRSTPNLQLQQLSHRLGVERHTVEKAIKIFSGKTFRDFRTDLLLAKATRLLEENPAQSIKEIAYTLGYNSQRSFCRFVKTTAGCSPTELRNGKKLFTHVAA
jgi:AraC-like DNA-binding protein